MKRSRHIQLVLITAALASCNRVILPRQSLNGNPHDSTLTAAPVYEDDSCGNIYNECCREAFVQLWSYSFHPTCGYYIGPVGSGYYYYPGQRYIKGSIWRSKHFVVRGGWGKSSSSASS